MLFQSRCTNLIAQRSRNLLLIASGSPSEAQIWLICHGGGIFHKALSDYARRIEYVDCNDKLQMVDDPHLLKVTARASSLLGVVTQITAELDVMTYAAMVRASISPC
jgi:hypothetical protein